MNRAFFILLFGVILTMSSFAGEPAAKPTPRKPMTLDSFAQATINVIREDGIAEYLPTIVLTETQEFRVIEGIPSTVDHRTAIQNVVRRSSYESKEFFFGVCSSPEQITIGHFRRRANRVYDHRQEKRRLLHQATPSMRLVDDPITNAPNPYGILQVKRGA
ncbi:MAG: hypothetical protein QM796_07000 [Chthoniobacteraceae bacterium]